MGKAGKKTKRDNRLRAMQSESLEGLTKAKADEIRVAQEWAISHARELGGNVSEFLSRKFTMHGRTKS